MEGGGGGNCCGVGFGGGLAGWCGWARDGGADGRGARGGWGKGGGAGGIGGWTGGAVGGLSDGARGGGSGESFLDGVEEGLSIDGFREDGEASGLFGVIAEVVTCDEDDFGGRETREDGITEGEPVDGLHDDIGDEEIEAPESGGMLEGEFGVRGGTNIGLGNFFEEGEERLDDAGVIIDQENSHGVWIF